MSLSVKARLISVLAGLSLAVLFIAAYGYSQLSFSNENIVDIHDDGVVPIEHLKVIADMYAVNIVDTAHKVRNGGLAWDEGVSSLDKASATIKDRWATYFAIDHSSEERQRLQTSVKLFAAADALTLELRKAFIARDHAMLDDIVINRLYDAIDPISEEVGYLIDFTIKEVKGHFEDTQASAATSTIIFIALIVMGSVIVLVGIFVVMAVTRNLTGMTEAMSGLAAGDTSNQIPALSRRDEIGAMAKAVQVFKDNMIDSERLRSEQEEMKRQTEIDQKAFLNSLADEFESSVKEIVETVSSAANELQATAQSMAGTADATSVRTTAVAAASEEASSNVQTVAAATEELSASVSEIGRQVAESSKIANAAVEEADRTNAQMRELSEAAQRIGDVVKLINDIASQTNLLALNATIEAARAGEAGKGFAVVASEVKNLATQTARATEEISTKIAEMQSVTDGSVKAIGTIGETIGRLNDIAASISMAVGEQLAATGEIANNVQQAATGTQEVNTNISEITQAAGETGAAASQVLSAAGELARQSGALQSNVVDFIARVRAA